MNAKSFTRVQQWQLAEGVLKVGSGVCALALAGLLAARTGPAAPELKPVIIYAPSTPTGEDVSEVESPANGFIFVIETIPAGAEVIVNGKSQGTTPASLNYECEPGSALALEVKARGFSTLKRSVLCKKDVMLVLNATLRRAK